VTRTASKFMEPLRAALGAGQSVDAALQRLSRHDAAIAPVILSGRPIGVVTRALLESASAFGLGDATVERVVTREVLRIGGRVAPRAVSEKSRGTAPGLLVCPAVDVIEGIIEREHLTLHLSRPGRARGARSLLTRLDAADRRNLLEARRVAAGMRLPLYLVGGAVRDLLLGRRIRSLDLAVEGDGIRFAGALARRLRARIVRHRRFGTSVLTLPDGGILDVATARREGYKQPASLPVVMRATMAEDFFRRDLTINAMAIRVDGRTPGPLWDPFQGVRDLRIRTLRVVHRLSFIEDPTRAFRAARLAARLGMRWHDETRQSLGLAGSVGAFAALSPQRRFREFVLMTQEPDPSATLRSFASLGILPLLVPGVNADRRHREWWQRLSRGEEALSGIPPAGSLLALLYLGLLLIGARRGTSERVLTHLGISGEPASRLASLGLRVLSLRRALQSAGGVRARPSRIARLCDAADPDARIIAWCCGEPSVRAAIAKYVQRLELPADVTGADLRRLGLPPGPIYGTILRRIWEARLDGRFDGLDRSAGRKAALRMATALARTGD